MNNNNINTIEVADKLAEVLVRSLSLAEAFHRLQSSIALGGTWRVGGLPGSLRSILIAALCREHKITIVVPDFKSGEALLDDLYLLLGEDEVCFLPPEQKSTVRRLHPEAVAHNRAESLSKLTDDPPKCLVVLVDTLWEKFPSLNLLKDNLVHLKVGSVATPQNLLRKVMNAGFRREVQVGGCGEAAVRGGIMDIFPYGHKNPIRIEFWGDDIVSLREFDVRSQRSVKNLDSVKIFLNRRHKLSETIFSLVDGLVFWEDFVEIEARYKRKTEADGLDPQNVAQGKCSLIHQLLGKADINFKGASAESFLGYEEDFFAKVKDYLSLNYTVALGAETDFRRERLMEAIPQKEVGIVEGLQIGILPLQKGFIFPRGKVAFFTERELYDRPRPKRSFARFRTYSRPVELEALKAGDFVVHEDYGIGIYNGLKNMKIAGHERECLHIKYRKDVSLYVRLEAFSKVQKYCGREGFVPPLSRIGSGDWNRTRNKTKKALMEIARDLILLQAKREVKKGIAFDRDDVWQKELEGSFVYEDTPDQSRASIEIKQDMENNRPMDRLLLGDVGFGKTEIAVRAAFKAVQSGHQVAILAPTTILVQQHLLTFKQRMIDYPVVVEALSRFRSPAEQRQVIKGLKEGKIDVVIGTHRLLSKDVGFKKLGLVVIDEEHRFGVKHKERLKELREEVDVLTLTATPIPRTMRMALAGTRDMSKIDTPPQDRQPIITEIVPFDNGVIREAILYEIKRNGQVFFVHNRVRSIESAGKMLGRIAPEARYAIAHGQMNTRQLEKVMLDFMEHKFDVLVCTMIVESGIDLPNVNTLIINRADRLGLAQLYQLRGRIGRSVRQAYAYLLIPPEITLTKEARSRLETIGQFTELGSGFQVALRDLEIRGAGNLLGVQQSGYINSMGYSLYSKMLVEAVQEVRLEMGLPTEEPAVKLETAEDDVRIDFAGNAHIPADYIEDQDLRVNFYRRLAGNGTISNLEKLEIEMIDRFGRIPPPLKNLLSLLRLKILARSLGIRALALNYQTFRLDFNHRDNGFKNIIEQAVLAARDMPIEFETSPSLTIKVGMNQESPISLLEMAESFLRKLAE